jgi:hypothetical protein
VQILKHLTPEQQTFATLITSRRGWSRTTSSVASPAGAGLWRPGPENPGLSEHDEQIPSSHEHAGGIPP